MKNYDTEDMIFALATPFAKGAIAVVRVSGEGCLELLEKHFKSYKKLSSYPSSRAVYGNLAGLDDCVITVYKDGHGYTGEEAAEISCHGGLETIKAVLEFLSSIGMRQAAGGEFSLRAFLHSKMDLTQAEAVNELINSKSSNAREMALNRLNGALLDAVGKIKNTVLEILSTIEVQLDYAEDEIGEDLQFPVDKLESAIESAKLIHSTFNTGRLYSQGAKVVLAGSTNAGKSSLFNYFLKEERAIVSDIKGTTRDYIEAQCSLEGIPVRLFDTAGLRESSDFIEAEGIRRSNELINQADIIIYLRDSSDESPVNENIVNDSRTILVSSKCDLYYAGDGIKVSALTGEGFDKLTKAIICKLKDGVESINDTNLIIESQRQKDDLARVMESLESALEHVRCNLPLDIVTLDIQEALEALGEITGEVTTDDILDKIFSTFCVGK